MTMDSRFESLLAINDKLQQTLLGYATQLNQRFNASFIGDAISDFFLHEAHEGHDGCCFDVDAILEDCSDNVVPWFLYNWQPGEYEFENKALSLPNQPIAKTFLEEKAGELAENEQAFIKGALSVPFRFYQITAFGDHSIDLTDLLSGTQHTVLTDEIDEAYELEDIITARILTLNGISMMISIMDVILPSEAKEDIRAVRSDANWDDAFCDDIVRQVYLDLSSHYMDDVEEEEGEWDNSDEHDIQFVTINYRLSCTTQEAFELLYPLCDENARDVLLENAHKSDTGEVKQISFPWLDEECAFDDQDFEESLLGMVSLEGAELSIEVNSAALAVTIKEHIRDIFGDKAVLESERIESLEDVIAALPEAERKAFEEL